MCEFQGTTNVEAVLAFHQYLAFRDKTQIITPEWPAPLPSEPSDQHRGLSNSLEQRQYYAVTERDYKNLSVGSSSQADLTHALCHCIWCGCVQSWGVGVVYSVCYDEHSVEEGSM